MKTIPAGRLLLAVAALITANVAWGQACTLASHFMEVACKSEAREDFWIGYANCKNLSNNADVRDCYAETTDERNETFEECGELEESRNEVCELLGDGPYDPDFAPENFLSPEEAADNPNPWLPLIPGTTLVYEVTGFPEDDEEKGEGEGEPELLEIITVTVTDETREIAGVETFVVTDIVMDPEGEVIEDTDDYYAMHVDGSVWYFGEIAQNFEDGFLTDIEGSFIAGEDDAKPGIIMLADPQPGDAYRQEFLLDDAEDVGQVLSLTGDESTEVADCEGACLVIKDLNPLEPDADEDKYYKAGIGVILEVDNEDDERVELVEIINPE